MNQLLSLSRASRLLSVTRGALQQRILAGELSSFDGMVSSEELARLYPDLNVEQSGAFEKVVQIKEHSFARRVREGMLPSAEQLLTRVVAQAEELADLRRHLSRYHQLAEHLRTRINYLSAGSGSPSTADIRELEAQLEDGLAKILASEETANRLHIMDDILRVIAAHVTLKPSGHEFFVEGSESLLSAALRAGLSPPYGCGNGNCGLCKTRVLSGKTRQISAADYPFSQTEKAQNYVLLCAHTAISDLSLEILEADSPNDIPEQHVLTRVKSIDRVGEDILLLHLQTPRSQRLRFLAGQEVYLGVGVDKADFRSAHPIASCPCDDRNLLFHIPPSGDDGLGQRLFAGAVSTGDTINVHGPWGHFVLDKAHAGPLLFICAHTGFAPVASLIEHAIALDEYEAMSLIWDCGVSAHYAANQCRAWQEALDNFSYYLVCSANGQSASDADRATSTLAVLKTVDLARQRIYLSGDEAFVRVVHRALTMEHQLPESQILTSTCA